SGGGSHEIGYFIQREVVQLLEEQRRKLLWRAPRDQLDHCIGRYRGIVVCGFRLYGATRVLPPSSPLDIQPCVRCRTKEVRSCVTHPAALTVQIAPGHHPESAQERILDEIFSIPDGSCQLQAIGV